MKNPFGHRILGCMLIIVFALGIVLRGWAAAAPAEKDKDDALLSTMQAEMQRARRSLGKLDPAPYFLSYSVYDRAYPGRR